MDQLIFYLIPVGIVLLSSFFYLGRLERSEALRLWILGFGALFGGALSILLDTVVGWSLTAVFSACFVGLMYAGSRRFVGRPIPAWVLPLTLLVGGSRALATLAVHPKPMALVAAIFSVVLLGDAGRLIGRHARETRAGLAERTLGPGMAVLGVLLGGSIGIRFLDVDVPTMFGIWIYVAVAVALLQILAGFERGRRIEHLHQQAIEQQSRTLRAVIETAPVDIVLRDDQGGIRMANRSAAERFGIELDAAGEPLPGQRLPSELAEELTGGNGRGQRLADAPEAVIERAEVRPEDHREVTLEVFSSPVTGDAGDSLGRLWVARDITQERRLQQELVQSQKMETLGTLAGGIAHDFNNQLTTILGNTRIAAGELREDQTLIAECLEDLERAAEHCASLTQGLLAFARRNPSPLRSLDVGSLLTEVGALLQATLPSRIHLDFTTDDDVWQALADPTRLKQVILNLAINGRDAIPATGSIRIDAHNETIASARTTATGDARPGRYVEFTVEDTGVGIDTACLQYIFDPFFTTKPTGEGTGLGLAIVYGVVNAHGGYVDVESQPGCTRVRVGIPAVDEPAEDPTEAAPPPPRGDGETVLLADDEPALRRLMRRQLEDLGYEVLEADSGERAIELADEPTSKIDIAVLDLSMPGMDGLETLEVLRRERPGLPGLIVSGFLDANDEERAKEGAEVLQKPFVKSALARAVRRTLGR